eukprot:jgi/Mesvir1/24019/Mv10761-RA.2
MSPLHLTPCVLCGGCGCACPPFGALPLQGRPCIRGQQGRCPYDHDTCHFCLAHGHAAKACPEAARMQAIIDARMGRWQVGARAGSHGADDVGEHTGSATDQSFLGPQLQQLARGSMPLVDGADARIVAQGKACTGAQSYTEREALTSVKPLARSPAAQAAVPPQQGDAASMGCVGNLQTATTTWRVEAATRAHPEEEATPPDSMHSMHGASGSMSGMEGRDDMAETGGSASGGGSAAPPDASTNTAHMAQPYLYVVGGRVRGQTVGIVERLPLLGGAWERCPLMLEPRGSLGVAAVCWDAATCRDAAARLAFGAQGKPCGMLAHGDPARGGAAAGSGGTGESRGLAAAVGGGITSLGQPLDGIAACHTAAESVTEGMTSTRGVGPTVGAACSSDGTVVVNEHRGEQGAAAGPHLWPGGAAIAGTLCHGGALVAVGGGGVTCNLDSCELLVSRNGSIVERTSIGERTSVGERTTSAQLQSCETASRPEGFPGQGNEHLTWAALPSVPTARHALAVTAARSRRSLRSGLELSTGPIAAARCEGGADMDASHGARCEGGADMDASHGRRAPVPAGPCEPCECMAGRSDGSPCHDDRLVGSAKGQGYAADASGCFDQLYAVGGWLYGDHCATNVECFDVHARSWRVCAPLLAPRRLHGVASVGSRLYAFGGIGGHGPAARGPTKLAECYIPDDDEQSAMFSEANRGAHAGGEGNDRQQGGLVGAGQWVPIAPLPAASCTCACTVGEAVYVLCWEAGTVLRYDPGSDSYQLVGPLPMPEWYGFAAVAWGPWVYAVGGTTKGRLSKSLFRLDTRSEAWEELPGMKIARRRCAAAICWS